MTEFTATDKWKAAEREVQQRRRVYSRLIVEKKMTESFAAEQIAIMQSIANDYAALAEKDRLI